MADHRAIVRWSLGDGDFPRGRYSRVHSWSFDGGVTVAGSSAPSVVHPPFSDPAAVDPEEAFVAALSSCHMLSFLYVASKAGFVVSSYEDEAIGRMTKNEHGVPWVSHVVLAPRHEFVGDKKPTREEVDALHERAHHECFIANSVKTEIEVKWEFVTSS